MDSLTQIVLGAAVGEAVLGKKVGNRAMLWGAIAGTIPDLDIISNLWLSDLQGLAAHRGFSHSFLFAILGALVMGYTVSKIYDSPYHKWISVVARTLLIGSFTIGLFYLGVTNEGIGKFIIPLIAITIAGLAFRFIKRRYFDNKIEMPEATMKDWIKLFFWSIVTHPILDSFTVYGTQLFSPFSDTRVSFNNISVADPAYTLPFLICLIIASFYHRKHPLRSKINTAGIIISSLYMIMTFFNQSNVKTVFAENLLANEIEAKRTLVSPTIFNNILWYCVAELEDELVFGRYSLMDQDKEMVLHRLPKNEALLAGYETDEVTRILKWFSDGYYHININESGQTQFNDMRYGPFDFQDYQNPDNFIFKFKIDKEKDKLVMTSDEGGPPDDVQDKFVNEYLGRIMGDKKIDYKK